LKQGTAEAVQGVAAIDNTLKLNKLDILKKSIKEGINQQL